jgi:hypothetical protein
MGCSLGVINGVQRRGHVTRLACPAAGQWRHDHAVPECQLSNSYRLQQSARRIAFFVHERFLGRSGANDKTNPDGDDYQPAIRRR